jgi:two-component system response regulator ChvI
MHQVIENAPRNILVVDDDALFRDSIAQNLTDKGYRVETFGDGPSCLTRLAEGPKAGLLLLDWKMPEMNGIEVLGRIREMDLELPVIFLTVLSEQIYEEAALLGGAVDFVEKSRSFSIVLRRIELTLEGWRGGTGDEDDASTPGQLTVGELRLDTRSGRAYWKGEPVELTLSEFGMVRILASRANNDVAYRDMYDVARGHGFQSGRGSEGYRANVRSSIKRIRHKFREIDDNFDIIENYPGFGYCWRIS